MFDFIKRIIQKYKLSQLPNLHKKRYIPLGKAQKVAFVYNLSESGAIGAINTLCDELSRLGIEYFGVGISTAECTDSLGKNISQIDSKEVDWIGIPVTLGVEDVFQREYDIVFDLSTTSSFTIEYLLRRLKCSTIVGYCSCREEYYDITFSNPDADKCEECIGQSFKYLNSIKTE